MFVLIVFVHWFCSIYLKMLLHIAFPVPLQDSLPSSCKNVEINKDPNVCQAIPSLCGNFLDSHTKFDAIPRDHILYLVYLLFNWSTGEWNASSGWLIIFLFYANNPILFSNNISSLLLCFCRFLVESLMLETPNWN